MMTQITTALRALALLWASLVLVACSGGVGPDPSTLIGSWDMPEEQPLGGTGSGIILDDVTVIYAKNGTSEYRARMRVDTDGTISTYRLDADVRWTLEETILTRTLETMRVTPETDSEAAQAFAEAFAAQANTSPPARFIVEQLDAQTLILLDPDTGGTVEFKRSLQP